MNLNHDENYFSVTDNNDHYGLIQIAVQVSDAHQQIISMTEIMINMCVDSRCNNTLMS